MLHPVLREVMMASAAALLVAAVPIAPLSRPMAGPGLVGNAGSTVGGVVGGALGSAAGGSAAGPAGAAAGRSAAGRGARNTAVVKARYTDAAGRPCRLVEQSVTIDGETVRARGTICRMPDGRWALVP
jgi:hypothetical protein